MELRIYVEPG